MSLRMSVYRFTIMPNLKFALRNAVQDSVRHHRRDRVAGARHRRERGDLSRSSTSCCCSRCRSREPARLVNLAAPGPKPGFDVVQHRPATATTVFSYPMFRDLEKVQTRRSPASPRIAPSAPTSRCAKQTIRRRGHARLRAATFRSLGVQPAIGRLLGPGDDPATGRVARRRPEPRVLAARSSAPTPACSNQSMIVNGQTMTIVGVRRARFRRARRSACKPHVFVPITMRERSQPDGRASTTGAATGRICSRGSSRACRIEQAQRGAEHAVSRDHQRRRSAAAEGHERADAGAVQARSRSSLERRRSRAEQRHARGEGAAAACCLASPGSCC